jgi:exopolyphosphatase/guanosine-5'-triphosphate,3'-diphosphate pyrophosphatase
LIESREDRRTVSTMALLLRLAAALDRRPGPVVASVRVRRIDAATFEITLVPEPSPDGEGGLDLSLECWSLRSCAPVVLEASGLELRVTAMPLKGMGASGPAG